MDNFKIRIVKKGAPTPPLLIFVVQHKANAEYTRHLFISQHEQVDWLAGCGAAHKLYCWRLSFLFSDKHEVWNKHGFLDLNYLSSAQQNTQNNKPMCTDI